MHIDTNDPRYRDAASEKLRRHDNFDPEANITSAVRDFLILTRLVRGEGESAFGCLPPCC
jgi:hypothetical protein